jgi:hypothetical protein
VLCRVVLCRVASCRGVVQDHTLPLKRLINFDRVGPVAAGASTTVGFDVSPMADLQFATAAGGMTLYEGTHEIVFWRGSGAEVTFPIEVTKSKGGALGPGTAEHGAQGANYH